MPNDRRLANGLRKLTDALHLDFAAADFKHEADAVPGGELGADVRGVRRGVGRRGVEGDRAGAAELEGSYPLIEAYVWVVE